MATGPVPSGSLDGLRGEGEVAGPAWGKCAERGDVAEAFELDRRRALRDDVEADRSAREDLRRGPPREEEGWRGEVELNGTWLGCVPSLA